MYIMDPDGENYEVWSGLKEILESRFVGPQIDFLTIPLMTDREVSDMLAAEDRDFRRRRTKAAVEAARQGLDDDVIAEKLLELEGTQSLDYHRHAITVRLGIPVEDFREGYAAPGLVVDRKLKVTVARNGGTHLKTTGEIDRLTLYAGLPPMSWQDGAPCFDFYDLVLEDRPHLVAEEVISGPHQLADAKRILEGRVEGLFQVYRGMR